LRDESSVKGLLDLMKCRGRIGYYHDRVHSVEELNRLLKKWGQSQYRSYSIGYFAFHGSPGRMYLGRQSVTLEHLADVMNGSCKGKTLFFGSCGVLEAEYDEVEEFRQAVGARCVMGYREEVDWFESAAFELLLFDSLTRRQRMDAVDRDLMQHKELRLRLGFDMFYGQPRRSHYRSRR
jgi:hypothetical protein